MNVHRPSWASTDHAFAYVCLGAFAIVALFIVNLRRSTTGLALNAVRWSEPGSRTLGISVVQMKIIVAGLGALVAGIGGGFLVTAQTSAQPANFATFLGVVWLAVLVTIGIRSNVAALVAGLAFTLLPALVQAYLPHGRRSSRRCSSASAPSGWRSSPTAAWPNTARYLRRGLLHLGQRRSGRPSPSGSWPPRCARPVTPRPWPTEVPA